MVLRFKGFEQVSPEILSAAIGAAVALLGMLITGSWYYRQSRQRALEIKAASEAKTREIDIQIKKLELDVDALRQAQFAEIIAQRALSYPKLWSIMCEYLTHWSIRKKDFDSAWAHEFLEKIITFNEHSGCFFSQDVYEKFHHLRSKMTEMCECLDAGENISISDIDYLNEIFIGALGQPGLATFMKDDLGSYQSARLSLRDVDKVRAH